MTGTNNIAFLTRVTYVTGMVDRAFSFHGPPDCAVIHSTPSINFGSNVDFSIEAWVQAAPTNSSEAAVQFVGKRSASGPGWIG